MSSDRKDLKVFTEAWHSSLILGFFFHEGKCDVSILEFHLVREQFAVCDPDRPWQFLLLIGTKYQIFYCLTLGCKKVSIFSYWLASNQILLALNGEDTLTAELC